MRGVGRESSEQVSGGGEEVDRISGGPSEVIGSVRRFLPSFLFLPEKFQVTHRVFALFIAAAAAVDRAEPPCVAGVQQPRGGRRRGAPLQPRRRLLRAAVHVLRGEEEVRGRRCPRQGRAHALRR